MPHLVSSLGALIEQTKELDMATRVLFQTVRQQPRLMSIHAFDEVTHGMPLRQMRNKYRSSDTPESFQTVSLQSKHKSLPEPMLPEH